MAVIRYVVVSGGTGSGKTTLLNVVSGYLPDDERIVTIEDAAELQLRQRHVARLEARPGGPNGRPLISAPRGRRSALGRVPIGWEAAVDPPIQASLLKASPVAFSE